MNKTKRNKEELRRISFLFAGLVVIGFVLIGRLFFIQIVSGETYSNKALDQYIRPAENLIDRGDIYLSPKNNSPLPVATIEQRYTAYVNPQILQGEETAHEALSNILEIDKRSFFEKASKENDPYEILARSLNKQQATEITKLAIPGVATHNNPIRSYPAQTLAADVIGFMSFNEDLFTGTHGIERSMNEELSGSVNEKSINVFAEILSDLGENNSNTSADVILTIDPAAQIFLEKQLALLTDTLQSQKSGGIIIDPQTGDIIAMAAYPTFDPNTYAKTDPSLFTNPNIEQVFEMGSIIKPITMAAGINSGAVTPNTHYQDSGSLDVDGYTISNYDGRARGWVDMQAVLSNSLNTGAAYVAEEMGTETFRGYFKEIFGGSTGVHLPFETENLIDNLDSPRGVEYATASFGQGIALTPLSTARALSTLGNGGQLISPRIVKKIQYDDGTTKIPEKTPPRRVFDEETSKTISRMLVTVFDEALRGGRVKIDTHTVAAKTGTAQISNNENGYSEDAFLHSFFGYFPAFEPEFLVLLYTEQPRGVEYASQSLTDPFMNITNFLIDYYNIPPDR